MCNVKLYVAEGGSSGWERWPLGASAGHVGHIPRRVSGNTLPSSMLLWRNGADNLLHLSI